LALYSFQGPPRHAQRCLRWRSLKTEQRSSDVMPLGARSTF